MGFQPEDIHIEDIFVDNSLDDCFLKLLFQ